MANEGKVVVNTNGVETVREPTAQELLDFNTSTQFERALSDLRVNRNHLLAQTDWIVTKAKETDTTIPTDWKTYRQALRDITNGLTTVADVEAVTWPTKP